MTFVRTGFKKGNKAKREEEFDSDPRSWREKKFFPYFFERGWDSEEELRVYKVVLHGKVIFKSFSEDKAIEVCCQLNNRNKKLVLEFNQGVLK